MKKQILTLLCVAMAALALGGCAANASGTTATAAPIVTGSPSMQPAATIAPETSPAMDGGMNGGMNGGLMGTNDTNTAAPAGMTPAQAGRLAEQIADEVERISEIDDAEVVVSNERVLVAVEFEDQYNAGLDDRMKQMIIQAVQKVDSNLTEISITDDDTLYGQVKGLGQRLAKATGLDELADDFGDLWDRITGR
ncbi:MAG: YhcN/YlaJ family sporulation lipoprotein [Candidatus Ventricola sp.]